MQAELSHVRSSSEEFQQAVTASCELELERLDSEAVQLQEQIRVLCLSLRRQREQQQAAACPAVKVAAVPAVASTAPSNPVAPVAASGHRQSSLRPVFTQPPASDGSMSTPTRPTGGPPVQSSPARLKSTTATATARNQPPRAPCSSPRRFAPFPNSAVAAQLRTPPRSSAMNGPMPPGGVSHASALAPPHTPRDKTPVQSTAPKIVANGARGPAHPLPNSRRLAQASNGPVAAAGASATPRAAMGPSTAVAAQISAVHGHRIKSPGALVQNVARTL